MASQVLSGSSKGVTYTNNTGQNVRLVINFLGHPGDPTTSGTPASGLVMSWGNSIEIVSRFAQSIGKGLAYSGGTTAGNNVYSTSNNMFSIETIVSNLHRALPTELVLAPGQTFNARSWTSPTADILYNILIIPENG